MTKVVLISSFLLMGFLAKAQDFQGKAEYFSKRIMKKKTEKIEVQKNEPLDPELQKEIEIAIKKATEKQYVLTFNKTECLYEEEQKLEEPKPSSGTSFSITFSRERKKSYGLVYSRYSC